MSKWIEEAIFKSHIKHEYNDFSNFQEIDSGAFKSINVMHLHNI